MAYLINDLDPEDKKNNGATTATPPPSTTPAQGVAKVVAPQQTAQQQRGTGFTNLSDWLNAGKGRDQAIQSTGTAALKTEADKFGAASDKAESGLASQKAIDLQHPERDLDAIGSGISQWSTNGLNHIVGALNQKYTGPSNIDYQAGDDFQNAKMLGNTSTVADVLGKDAISKGQYTGGMRALDNVLYGADSASQQAIKENATNTDAFQKDALAKAGDFQTRAQKRSDEISSAADKTRTDLQAIGDQTKASLTARANAANALALADSQSMTMARDPNTGKLVPIPKGQVAGGWEGAAVGSANAGNVMTDAENSRFSALRNLLGYDAPTKTGTYQEGRLTTKANGDMGQLKPGIADDTTNKITNIINQGFQSGGNSLFNQNQIQNALYGEFVTKGGMTRREFENLMQEYYKKAGFNAKQ